MCATPALVDAAGMDANTLDQGFVAAVRRLLGWLVVLGCAAILLPCLLVAGIDASAHGEEWDGLGLFLAAVVGIPAVTALVLQTLALRLESRRPLVSRVLTVVVALRPRRRRRRDDGCRERVGGAPGAHGRAGAADGLRPG